VDILRLRLAGMEKQIFEMFRVAKNMVRTSVRLAAPLHDFIDVRTTMVACRSSEKKVARSKSSSETSMMTGAKTFFPESGLNLHGYHHFYSSVFEHPSHPAMLNVMGAMLTLLMRCKHGTHYQSSLNRPPCQVVCSSDLSSSESSPFSHDI